MHSATWETAKAQLAANTTYIFILTQGDIAQWYSIRLQIERSLVQTRVSPKLLYISFVFVTFTFQIMTNIVRCISGKPLWPNG